MLPVLRNALILIGGLLLVSMRVFAGQGLNDEGASNVEPKKTLRLAGPPWEPFLYEQQPRKGLATEIVIEAFERAGYSVEVSIKPWRRVLAEAEKGMVDVLIGLWFNEQRASNFLYSDPYYVNQISFISDQSEVISYQKLDDLKGLKIGVRKGASFGHNFDNAAALNKTPMVNALSMLKMLALGRIDIGIGDHLILSRLMQKNKMLNEQLKFVEPAYTERELHMAIVKSLADHQAIVSAFNHHLRKMKQQGRVKEIIKTYSP